MGISFPSTYDIPALERDLSRVKQEIQIFSQKLEELKERKEQLENILKALKDRRDGVKTHGNFI